ncbi:MAG TPA: AhpC/TSA family protein [Ktedonobacteraceae bacterium]|jgi:hypothetical protein
MDLRTFLHPAPIAVQAAPVVGKTAPDTIALPNERNRPYVIAFLRHTGCPFAEATLHELRACSLAHPTIEWVAVSHAAQQPTSAWCKACGGTGQVHFLSDEKRTLYATWGLGLTTASHFLGRRSLAGVLRLARQGIRNRHPSGTRWQMAGTFAVDASGVVRWQHLPRHAGDLPDLGQAIEALERSEQERSAP